jgi:hypothetical protein
LLAVFTDLDSARNVGVEYLRSRPEETDLRKLLAALCGSSSIDATDAAHDWAATLAAKCRDDFLERRVVHVDAWVLSWTEARLCALAVLV